MSVCFFSVTRSAPVAHQHIWQDCWEPHQSNFSERNLWKPPCSLHQLWSATRKKGFRLVVGDGFYQISFLNLPPPHFPLPLQGLLSQEPIAGRSGLIALSKSQRRCNPNQGKRLLFLCFLFLLKRVTLCPVVDLWRRHKYIRYLRFRMLKLAFLIPSLQAQIWLAAQLTGHILPCSHP